MGSKAYPFGAELICGGARPRSDSPRGRPFANGLSARTLSTGVERL
jgi:hypothetical protein